MAWAQRIKKLEETDSEIKQQQWKIHDVLRQSEYDAIGLGLLYVNGHAVTPFVLPFVER